MSLQNKVRFTLAHADCEIAWDALTRQAYATDASIYEVEPLAVAFPRSQRQASSLLRTAAESEIPVIPRGAGTGLVGGALGAGLIVDFARYNRQISDLNLEQRSVRVGAGVVLDQLNAFLKPHGCCFGPDVATSSRATVGGMIANNSSGARVPVYGTTSDHVLALEIVLADGRVETIGPDHPSLGAERELALEIASRHTAEIADRMPPGLLKRWPGYALDRFLRHPKDLTQLLGGSEGTLAGIISAQLRILPLPREKGLGLIFFASVAEAMQATVELLDLKPAAIEHIDRILFDQTQDQLPFRAARDLLELDAKPCESILLVEFYDDVAARLNALSCRRLGLRTATHRQPAEMNLVWGLRKAGLSLLTSRKGPAKPVTCVEDTAVRPEQLPEYVRGLDAIMKPLNLEVCYYGHAAAGLLHVRPVLDLHQEADVRKLRSVADQVSALVRQFKGSLAAEHGVGMARTEYMAAHLGPELMGAMRSIKDLLDPRHLLNPGKILDDGRFRMDQQLRLKAEAPPSLPFTPRLAFAKKDGSFLANLEQCNGCGGCRKEAPTMCPTFSVTGDELMSTRGRANIIRAVLERRLGNGDPLGSAELELALSNCLACKACTTECPSNVNMSLLKAELSHAQHRQHGLTVRARVLSAVDVLGKLGCLTPRLANAILRAPAFRHLLARTLGLSAKRPLPEFAHQRFDRWFARRARTASARRGQVILWDDTFVRYYEPQIGTSAVALLEAAGFEVLLLRDRACCGRPAFSQGHLDRATQLGRHNLALLNREQSSLGNVPILFLEPSCYSMFAEDYRELNLPGAESVAVRSFLFEQFIGDLLRREPGAIQFNASSTSVAIHAHCHAKSLATSEYMAPLAQRATRADVKLLNTGCCGMAGAFGALESKIALSGQVAEPLVQLIQQQPPGTAIVASGTSCRQQIRHLTSAQPLHLAELLAAALPARTDPPIAT